MAGDGGRGGREGWRGGGYCINHSSSMLGTKIKDNNEKGLKDKSDSKINFPG